MSTPSPSSLPLRLGIDIGTSSIKLVATLPHTSSSSLPEIFFYSQHHPNAYMSEHLQRIQNVKKIIFTIGILLSQLVEKMNSSSDLYHIGSIHSCCQMHGILMFNRQKTKENFHSANSSLTSLASPIFSPLVTWEDNTVDNSFLMIINEMIARRGLAPLHHGYGSLSLLYLNYLRSHPHAHPEVKFHEDFNFDHYDCFGTIGDFFAYILSVSSVHDHQDSEVLMSISNAAAIGLFDEKNDQWILKQVAIESNESENICHFEHFTLPTVIGGRNGSGTHDSNAQNHHGTISMSRLRHLIGVFLNMKPRSNVSSPLSFPATHGDESSNDGHMIHVAIAEGDSPAVLCSLLSRCHSPLSTLFVSLGTSCQLTIIRNKNSQNDFHQRTHDNEKESTSSSSSPSSSSLCASTSTLTSSSSFTSPIGFRLLSPSEIVSLSLPRYVFSSSSSSPSSSLSSYTLESFENRPFLLSHPSLSLLVSPSINGGNSFSFLHQQLARSSSSSSSSPSPLLASFSSFVSSSLVYFNTVIIPSTSWNSIKTNEDLISFHHQWYMKLPNWATKMVERTIKRERWEDDKENEKDPIIPQLLSDSNVSMLSFAFHYYFVLHLLVSSSLSPFSSCLLPIKNFDISGGLSDSSPIITLMIQTMWRLTQTVNGTLTQIPIENLNSETDNQNDKGKYTDTNDTHSETVNEWNVKDAGASGAYGVAISEWMFGQTQKQKDK